MLVPTRVAAEALGIHANTLRKWADEGRIPYEKRRLDNGVLILENPVRRFRKACKSVLLSSIFTKTTR